MASSRAKSSFIHSPLQEHAAQGDLDTQMQKLLDDLYIAVRITSAAVAEVISVRNRIKRIRQVSRDKEQAADFRLVELEEAESAAVKSLQEAEAGVDLSIEPLRELLSLFEAVDTLRRAARSTTPPPG